MKILLLLLSAILFSGTFSEVNSADRAESSLASTRRRMQPDEEADLERVKAEMRTLYENLSSKQQILALAYVRHDDPEEIAHIDEDISALKNRIIALRPQLRDAFRLRDPTDSKDEYEYILGKIRELEYKVRRNERILITAGDKGISTAENWKIRDKNRKNQACIIMWESKKQRIDEKIKRWEHPERVDRDIVPIGMKYV